ncbi:beta-amylase 3, chloroplastic-like [Telopea speciosissima]|uniref:beta-amylase 3, chloroplastic-like n=1 Tax=Telopea speciosissima TaxID=54955 RepID=UPI001CC3AC6B|nr:beta-amylase 3, chloroplastic-like [Telopea speciosissima]
MAIASSAFPSSISASFCYSRSEPARFVRFPSITVSLTALKQYPSRFSLNSSKPSGTGGSVSPGDEDLEYELQHGFAPPQRRKGASVFVKLPVDASSMIGNSEGRKKLVFSLKALTAAGVEGVVMEVWWGYVEDTPENYDWRAYLDLVAMVRDCKLKVRAVMAFHQWRTEPAESRESLWLVLCLCSF